MPKQTVNSKYRRLTDDQVREARRVVGILRTLPTLTELARAWGVGIQTVIGAGERRNYRDVPDEPPAA